MAVTYDLLRGELDLARWIPSPVDDLVPTSPADPQTVVTFALRRSVQALREAQAELARQALLALTRVDPRLYDRRDLTPAIGLAQYALWRLGADVDSALTEAAKQAPSEAKAIFAKYAGIEPARRSLDALGFHEVHTRHGFGLVTSDGDPYHPRADLAALVVALADIVDASGYQTTGIVAATVLPNAWFPRGTSPPVRGCARVEARYRSDAGNPMQDLLTVVLAEAEDEAAADQLVATARPPGTAYAAWGRAYGALFGLVIARSFARDRPGRETNQSLHRFEPPIAEVLRAAATTE